MPPLGECHIHYLGSSASQPSETHLFTSKQDFSSMLGFGTLLGFRLPYGCTDKRRYTQLSIHWGLYHSVDRGVGIIESSYKGVQVRA